MAEELKKKRLTWHRLFGLALDDYLSDTGYKVALEMDLSVKRQFLDVVVVQADENAKLVDGCDGLEFLKPHNLITYKSMHESMNEWALDELIGHYVNYCKLINLTTAEMRSEAQLFAVTTRFPRKLLRATKAKKSEEMCVRSSVWPAHNQADHSFFRPKG